MMQQLSGDSASLRRPLQHLVDRSLHELVDCLRGVDLLHALLCFLSTDENQYHIEADAPPVRFLICAGCTCLGTATKCTDLGVLQMQELLHDGLRLFRHIGLRQLRGHRRRRLDRPLLRLLPVPTRVSTRVARTGRGALPCWSHQISANNELTLSQGRKGDHSNSNTIL